MQLTNQQNKGREILSELFRKAWNNEEFKTALIHNPKQTLERMFGKIIPDSRKIKVTDQSDPDFLYINIPVNPQDENFRLSGNRMHIGEDGLKSERSDSNETEV